MDVNGQEHAGPVDWTCSWRNRDLARHRDVRHAGAGDTFGALVAERGQVESGEEILARPISTGVTRRCLSSISRWARY